MVLKPAGQASRSETFDLVRVGVGGQELERRVPHSTPKGLDPVRPQDFQQAIEPRHGGGAPVDEASSDLHGALERITRAERLRQMQPFGMKHGKARQHLGVKAVGLRVFGEVVPEVR